MWKLLVSTKVIIIFKTTEESANRVVLNVMDPIPLPKLYITANAIVSGDFRCGVSKEHAISLRIELFETEDVGRIFLRKVGI
jgi:hypothetical protein